MKYIIKSIWIMIINITLIVGVISSSYAHNGFPYDYNNWWNSNSFGLYCQGLFGGLHFGLF